MDTTNKLVWKLKLWSVMESNRTEWNRICLFVQQVQNFEKFSFMFFNVNVTAFVYPSGDERWW